MSALVAIDPGNTESAFVTLDARREIVHHGKITNAVLLMQIAEFGRTCPGSQLAIEMIASYGMPVGREVFETCVWIGRFVEAWGGKHAFVYRRDVKLYLCGAANAKDANIRQALIDRYGPGKARAIGTKKARGPLYGVTADVWSALAVAVTHCALEAMGKAA